MRLFMRGNKTHTDDNEWQPEKRTSQAEASILFVGARHKINDATLTLLGGISGPCFTASFRFAGM